MSKKRFLAIFLTLSLIVTPIAGCNNKADNDLKEDTKTEDSVNSGFIKITDHANREIEIPNSKDLKRVYSSNPIGFIWTYTLAPEKLSGSPLELTEEQLKYMSKEAKEYKTYGSQHAGKSLNAEELIKDDVQLIVSISPGKINDKTAEDADMLQEKLNIPVMVVDGNMDNFKEIYSLLGKVLGVEKRADELTNKLAKIEDSVNKAVKSIPEDKKVDFYYAESPSGLSTDPESSPHAAVFKKAGGINVADIESKQGTGLSEVSLEQVVKWNPSVIFSWADGFGGAYSEILKDASWQDIKAVKDEKVYQVPYQPFSWPDRPPSVNRFLGLQWITNTLYPEYYNVDMHKEVKDFYSSFYHVDLNEDEIKEVLLESEN